MQLTAVHQYFIEQAELSLRSSNVPGWALVTNQHQPVFRYWSSLDVVSTGDKESTEPIHVGDQVDTVVRFSPVVRLEGNYLVAFTIDGARVTKDDDDTQSFVTGFKATYLTWQAKKMLSKNSRCHVEIRATYVCVENRLRQLWNLVDDHVTLNRVRL